MWRPDLSLPIAFLLSALLLTAQTHDGRPALKLSNDRMELLILPRGGTIASVVLTDDSTKLNPLWNPGPKQTGSGLGHFLCLDGFGSPSAEEKKAGLPGHGEAVRQDFAVDSQTAGVISLSATLPLAQEKITRTYSVVAGEPVLYVKTRVQSLTAFDRPMVWAEHATIGSPFLEAGVTAVDVSGTRSQTRPWTEQRQHRLASARDFAWPTAPLTNGGVADLRSAPVPPNSMDHTTTLLDPSRQYAFVTAIHPARKLMVAWVWRTSDFPWLQSWESYTASGMARGLEFSTQPYDIPRREAVSMHRMFDTPTYRWFPAQSTIETAFALIYTQVPDGFVQVKDVRIAGGTITFDDPAGRSVPVRASGITELQRP